MKPITIKELKEFIKGVPDEVELYVEHYNLKPVSDLGLLTSNNSSGKTQKLLIQIKKFQNENNLK